MAALIETYSYDWMRAIPDSSSYLHTNKGILWNLVHALTGDLQVRDGSEGDRPAGAWTVAGSCNGTTSNYGGTNLWWGGGTYDGGNMQWVDGGVRGWIVLKSPEALLGVGGGRYMYLCFQLSDAATAQMRTVKTLASFTAFSGGNNTVMPSSATQFALSDGPFYSTDWYFSSSIADNYKTHLSLASDGAFFWGANRAAVSLRYALAVCKLLDGPASDLYPVATFRCHNTDNMQLNGNNAFPAGSLAASPASVISAWSPVFAEQDSGAAFGGSNSAGSPWAKRSPDNTSTIYLRPIMPIVRYRATVSIYTMVAAGPDNWTLDSLRQQYPEWQIWLHAVVCGASLNSIYGRVRDMHTAFGLSELTVEPSGSDPITRIVWGNTGGFWVPGNQVMTF